jgi:hypothetical protein
MRSLERVLITIGITMAMAVSANAAMARNGMARSYSGNWPLTVTHSRGANGTYCLTLTDNGSLGWRHSGPASLAGVGNGGTFQLIDNTLVATIQSPGASGQNEGLVFVASAGNGNITQGIYEGVYGGEEIDSGVLVFGMKGGC